jgi:hypothetical protein
MPRRLSALATATAALILAASPVLASSFPDEIDLPDGWLPEGIAAGPGTTVYSGSRANGDIVKIDLLTGETDPEFDVAPEGDPAVGLEYEGGADRLWVAGGGSNEVRVYDATTGELLETYTFPIEAPATRFVNDIVVTGDAAYATDSRNAELLVIPLDPSGALPDPDDAFLLALSGDWAQVTGFNANGIEAFGGWLLVVNSTTGQLFAVDPETGDAVEVLDEGSVTSGDGLLIVGNTLYVAQNAFDLVSVWRIKGNTITPIGAITDDTVAGEPDEIPGDLDFGTTIAFVGGSLWAVNARFSTAPTPTTPYWITRIPL